MPMKLKLWLVLVLLVAVTKLVAQQAKDSAPHKAAHKIFRPPTYLGNSDYCRGTIRKAELDQLLKQGISCHDSTGRKYKVLGFDFTYAERNLYEDSVGNLEVLSEYLNEHCPGDTLAASISATIYDRTKAGDTVFVDNVLVVRYNKNNQPMPDSTAFLGRGIKLVVIK